MKAKRKVKPVVFRRIVHTRRHSVPQVAPPVKLTEAQIWEKRTLIRAHAGVVSADAFGNVDVLLIHIRDIVVLINELKDHS